MNGRRLQTWEDFHVKVIGRRSTQCDIQGARNSRAVGVSGTYIRDTSNVAEVLLGQSFQVICNCAPHIATVRSRTGGLVDGNPCERNNLSIEVKEGDVSRQLYVDAKEEYMYVYTYIAGTQKTHGCRKHWTVYGGKKQQVKHCYILYVYARTHDDDTTAPPLPPSHT